MSPTSTTRSGDRKTAVRRAAFAGALIALGAARFVAPGPLWLDEALSVNIAELPVPALLEALRHDGSPPAYYLLLHGWMAVFGTGTVAVRALSGMCSLLALPVAWAAARRLLGREAGPPAVLLVAACPFAIRYGSETRMYALVMLLVLGWAWALAAVRGGRRLGPVIAFAGLTGLLMLTHYWTFFLLLVAEIGLLTRVIRERGGSAWRPALAVPAGAVLFLPWLDSFLFQARHTGTPWAPVPQWTRITATLLAWAGPEPIGVVLALLWLFVVARGWRQRSGRKLALLAVGSLATGIAADRLLGSGYALRYSAPMAAVAMLAVTAGVVFLRPRLRTAVLVCAVLLALAVVVWSPLLAARTQAGQTAALLLPRLGPGDVIVYCPDQLGPAVSRLLPAGTDQIVYPTMAGPERVDWVDYAARNAAADPVLFARRVAARATGTVWLVRRDGYRTFGAQCAALDNELTVLRGGRTVLETPGSSGETESLVRFDSE